MLLSRFYALLDKGKYQAADSFLQQSGQFQGKQTAQAAYLFASSGKTKILPALKLLIREGDKELHYWH